MRLTRVHVDQPLAAGSEVVLPESAAAHLGRVLRLGVGDACVLFNGDGHDYAARIVALGKRELRVAIDCGQRDCARIAAAAGAAAGRGARREDGPDPAEGDRTGRGRDSTRCGRSAAK